MAEKTATLVIKLKDMASSGVKGFQAGLNSLKTSFFAVTAALAGFVATGLSAIKAYSEQENAISKLENALRNQGVEVASTSKLYQDQAAQLQKNSTFSDELILETQALLTTFGVMKDQMPRVTQAALDLSTGLGIDLKSATMLLGKAVAGDTATLGRYGIKISETIPVTEKFAAVLGQVNARFGGSAQAAAETTAGRIEVLKNRFNDLQETLGRALLPVFESVMGFLQTMAGHLETVANAVNETGSAFAVFKMTMLESLKFVFEAFMMTLGPISGLMLKVFGIDTELLITRFNAAMDRQIAKVNQAALNQKTKSAEMTATQRQSVSAQASWMDEQRALEQKKEDEHYAKIKERVDKHFTDEMEARLKYAKFEEDVNAKRAANFESTLNFISTLATAKNKTLAAVGKAAAIAVATMDTYAASNKALASAPPPFNYGLAGAVTAAGIANVARISGVQLAEGGIVMPRRGGVQATIGEAGSPEAVIPLDDERAMGMMGGSNITIQAGVIIADKMSIREFARQIDRELFSLQRNKMSVSG